MTHSRSRAPLVLFGFLAGALLGLKTVVLLGFVFGVEPSLEPGLGLALSLVWVFAMAMTFAAAAAVATGRRKEGPPTAGPGSLS
jgi:hypothetical protein